jgi:CRISPR-associated endonuclease/helicase Cas3
MADEQKPYRTRTGKALTDAQIEAMADEAERGYEVTGLLARRRGRPLLGSAPAGVVPVRLDPDLRRAVQARADAEDATLSEIIRRALRRYVDVA